MRSQIVLWLLYFVSLTQTQDSDKLDACTYCKDIQCNTPPGSELPWMVHFRFVGKPISEDCIGSIISNTAILTAGSCFIDGQKDKKANLQAIIRPKGAKKYDEYIVSVIVRYPKYDLAIAFTEQKMEFEWYRIPICYIHPNEENKYKRTEVEVVGWDYQDRSDKEEITLLGKSDAPDNDPLQLFKYNGNKRCIGKIGSPIVRNTESDTYQMIGIVPSSGKCTEETKKGETVRFLSLNNTDIQRFITRYVKDIYLIEYWQYLFLNRLITFDDENQIWFTNQELTYGDTVLHKAVRRGNLALTKAIVKYLYENDEDTNPYTKDVPPKTVLQLAALSTLTNRFDCVRAVGDKMDKKKVSVAKQEFETVLNDLDQTANIGVQPPDTDKIKEYLKEKIEYLTSTTSAPTTSTTTTTTTTTTTEKDNSEETDDDNPDQEEEVTAPPKPQNEDNSEETDDDNEDDQDEEVQAPPKKTSTTTTTTSTTTATLKEKTTTSTTTTTSSKDEPATTSTTTTIKTAPMTSVADGQCGHCHPEGMMSCGTNGTCNCKEWIIGKVCDECEMTTYNFPKCQRCNCNDKGSWGQLCDPTTGQCSCKPNFTDQTCGFCKREFAGSKCDQCRTGYHGFPECKKCDCKPGAKSCDPINGKCHCKPGFYGKKCEKCDTDPWKLSNCTYCACLLGWFPISPAKQSAYPSSMCYQLNHFCPNLIL